MTKLRHLSLALLIASPAQAWGSCEEPSQRADVALGVEQATQAFRQLDREGFAAYRDRLIAVLPCLAEPLQPGDAASIHGLMALSAFLDKDDGGSVASLHAAVRSDPTFDLPAELFPDGHPLRLHLQVARSLQPGALRPLPQPAQGELSVDGVFATHAPGDRPSVLQWTVELTPRDTLYLVAGEPMPPWGPVPRGDQRRPWGLVTAAGVGVAAAGGLYALAGSSHTRFLDPATPYEELAGLQLRANALSVASVGTGLLTIGLGTAAVIRW